MGSKLDDNAHEAVRFLMLGAGLILLLRFVYWGVDRWLFAPDELDDLVRAIGPFRNGYLLTDQRTMVVGGMDLMGRSALALVATLCGGILAALAGALLAKASGYGLLRPAVLGARLGMVLTGAWSLFAMLFLPPHSTVIASDGITVRNYTAVLGELTLPLSGRVQEFRFEDLSGFEARSTASTFDGCGTREQVVMRQGDTLHVIAQLAPSGPRCAEAIAEATDRTARLAAMLEVHRVP